MLAHAILAQMSSPHTAMAVFWLAIAAIVIAPSLGYYWYKLKKTELEAGLKQTMLDRGMSAEEIVRVLGAGDKKDA